MKYLAALPLLAHLVSAGVGYETVAPQPSYSLGYTAQAPQPSYSGGYATSAPLPYYTSLSTCQSSTETLQVPVLEYVTTTLQQSTPIYVTQVNTVYQTTQKVLSATQYVTQLATRTVYLTEAQTIVVSQVIPPHHPNHVCHSVQLQVNRAKNTHILVNISASTYLFLTLS